MRAFLFTALLATLVQTPVELEKGLRSKDIDARLVAVEALAVDKDPRTEKLLLSAAQDEDWEVALRAIAGLGKRKQTSAKETLTKLALDAPIRSQRDAAAAALREIDPEYAAGQLGKKLAGNDALAALEALAIVLAGREGAFDLAPVLKLAEKAKDDAVRAAAAHVVGACNLKDRARGLMKLVLGGDVRLACAALDGLARAPRAGDLGVLLEVLGRPKLDDCVERRAIAATAAVCASGDAALDVQKIPETFAALLRSETPAVVGRAVVVIERLATDEGAARAVLTPDVALSTLKPALEHADALPRARAARALARLGPAALERARVMARGDKSARVRRAAFESLCQIGLLTDETNRGVALALLTSDPDPEVRRTAAVRLGVRELETAVEPLTAALADQDWGVGVCSAVSLGLTQSKAAVEPLVRLSKSAPDWKLRAAAVTGLTRVYDKGAVPAVIEAIGDPDPFVSRCAHLRMMVISHERLEAKREPWREWWEKNKERVLLVDPVVETEFRKRFRDTGTGGPRLYSDSDFLEIFRDQDVVVLESRGDRIQDLLARQKLDHRLTTAGKVGPSGLSADSVFVVNCAGEIEPPDVERLRWFVLAGGNLFGSCWALHETIERALPGPVEKYETGGDVVDSVEAFACSRSSQHLAGVFAPGLQPIYALEGAHLIEVREPERVEVLIDSPECAGKFGCGNLAAWFSAGHGHVLDSANHFEAQGLRNATHLKKPLERQAFAVDHMGLTFEKLRATRGAEWWSSAEKASREITDLSVFRIVTNFVRLRRLAR